MEREDERGGRSGSKDARGVLAARWLPVAAGALVLLWFHGAALVASVRHTLAPYHVTGDVLQQIFPFYRYLEPNAFGSDYIAEYYLACYPLGYRGLYASAARIGLDPALLSRCLPHLSWLITVLGLGAAAHKLGGKLAAFCALLLALGSSLYLDRTGGGLPRGFGFPIVAVLLAGLAYGRVAWCVACVIVGALFYPVAAVISGFSLAALLLSPERAGLMPGAWGWRRRCAVLGATGGLAIALLVPTMISCGRFGDPVRPREVAEFPEAGPGGRYSASSRAPFAPYWENLPGAIAPALLGGAEPLLPSVRAWLMDGEKRAERSSRVRNVLLALFVPVLVGAVGLAARAPAARRVLLLFLASVIGYTLARAVAPYAYLPERYVAYPIPLLATVAVAAGIIGAFPRSFDEGRRRWVRAAALGLYTCAVLGLFAGRVEANAGAHGDLRRHAALLEKIGTLPLDALVAGWPIGVVDQVPHVSRRRALVTYETHQAFHKEYIGEMRRRMGALIDAYFASSPEPLIRLRDEFGVTHLVVQRGHFGKKPPKYFKPFDRLIAERHRAGRKRGFEVPRQFGAASIFSRDGHELLDLSRVQGRSAERHMPPESSTRLAHPADDAPDPGRRGSRR